MKYEDIQKADSLRRQLDRLKYARGRIQRDAPWYSVRCGTFQHSPSEATLEERLHLDLEPAELRTIVGTALANHIENEIKMTTAALALLGVEEID